jgi:hypothetical protein
VSLMRTFSVSPPHEVSKPEGLVLVSSFSPPPHSRGDPRPGDRETPAFYRLEGFFNLAPPKPWTCLPQTHFKNALPFAMPAMSIADTPEVVPVCMSAIS